MMGYYGGGRGVPGSIAAAYDAEQQKEASEGLKEQWRLQAEAENSRAGHWEFPEPTTSPTSMSDPRDPYDFVNAPAHYRSPTGKLEAIGVIEEFELGFRLGNTVKYILRAGRKGDRLEDLRKARWYLDREIARSEG